MGQASQLGQQGSDYGQYGITPVANTANYPQSPYRQNGNSPYAPMGEQTDNYFGMYPKGQPSFGSNPYTPQTANIAGQPGEVKTMASGGNSTPYTAGNFKYTDPAKQWSGPVNVNPTSQQTSDQAMNAMFSSKGLGQPAPQPTNAGMKSPGMLSVMGQNNPEFMNAMGKSPAQPTQVAEPAPVPQANPASQIYKPVYDQYANIGLPRPRG